jgi:osmoprotectant transport system substrate-binding protein
MGDRRSVSFASALALIVLIGGCGSSSPAAHPRGPDPMNDDAVTVGSFDFAESELLAEVYSQALEHGGFRVERAFDLGPREFVAPALARGLIELVPEYAGTAVEFFGLGSESPRPDTTSTHRALLKALRGHDLAALAAAPAQNENAFVVTRTTAARYRLHDLSDLARAGPRLVFGGPPECPTRPLCLLGLQRVYGVRFEEVVSTLDSGGPVTRQALRDGDVDVGLLFTTDPTITEEGFVELTDDRGLQPAENITPVVRTEILDRWGSKLVDVVDAVSARLTTEALRQLNAQVSSGKTIQTVAASWLEAQRRP